MNLATLQQKVDEAFDSHTAKLVEVLCANLEFDPSQAQTYLDNFHRGLSFQMKARELVDPELEKIGDLT
jgi:hypothetical protein